MTYSLTCSLTDTLTQSSHSLIQSCIHLFTHSLVQFQLSPPGASQDWMSSEPFGYPCITEGTKNPQSCQEWVIWASSMVLFCVSLNLWGPLDFVYCIASEGHTVSHEPSLFAALYVLPLSPMTGPHIMWQFLAHLLINSFTSITIWFRMCTLGLVQILTTIVQSYRVHI